jgi:hypothetical protein
MPKISKSKKPEPSDDETTDDEQEPTPTVEEPEPAVEEPTPAVEEPEPPKRKEKVKRVLKKDLMALVRAKRDAECAKYAKLASKSVAELQALLE